MFMKHFAGHAFMMRWIGVSCLLIGLSGSGQELAIGTWRTHYSYNQARILETTDTKLFCAVENGLFSYSIADQSIRKLSKLDGLSGALVSAMHYDEIDQVLIIGYSSGLIDLIYEDRIATLRDVANSNLEGEKSINAITSENGIAYLGSDLGVIVITLSTSQIAENYLNIGSGGNQVAIKEIEVQSERLFVTTAQGIQSGLLNANLLDFNNWVQYESTEGFNNLTLVEDELYALHANELYRFNVDGWEPTNFNLPAGTKALRNSNNTHYSFTDRELYALDGNTFTLVFSVDTGIINDFEFFDNQFFIANTIDGLTDESGASLSPEGPLADNFSNIRVLQNTLYGFYAPSPISYTGTIQVPDFSVLSDGIWTSQTIENFTNVSDVAFFNGNFYFSSVGDGLYDELSNSISKSLGSMQQDTIIAGLASGDNLWVSSFGNPNPILLLDDQNNWSSFSAEQLFSDEFLTIHLSSSGVGWLGSSFGSITVLSPDDEQVEVINSLDGLPSDFTDINITVEDNVWVATRSGPAFFPSASGVFFSSDAVRPTFNNRTLFEDQQINSVITDGGNRVWFGTNQGLWVFDENTSEQIALFNEENSPIPSNVVLDLAYNGSSGEVFVLTNKGMVSYRSGSSIGNRRHRNVTVFPNPVRPGYSGLVGITGLARNVSLKITDINGNLVQEVDANGGTASWNLLDQSGSPVVTGTYFFFSASSDGEETFVGKVAVIR